MCVQAEEKANLLVNAVSAHTKCAEDVSKSSKFVYSDILLLCVCYTFVSQAISGQAIDRHLLGLKLTAAENGMETPGLFKDVAYSRSQHFRLSTSQVRSSHRDTHTHLYCRCVLYVLYDARI